MARDSETDLRRYDLTRGTRGKYVAKARRSFETIIVDKRIVAALGGAAGLTAILEAVAKSVARAKKRVSPAPKRRRARSAPSVRRTSPRLPHARAGGAEHV